MSKLTYDARSRPKWTWSWPLVKMATKAHVLHFECITKMFLKTNLAGWDLSSHVTGILNMQKSVHKKTDKTSLVRQVDFSRFYAEVISVYLTPLSVYRTAHCLWWNKWNKQIGNSCNYICIQCILINSYLLWYVMEIVFHSYISHRYNSLQDTNVCYISAPILKFIFKMWWKHFSINIFSILKTLEINVWLPLVSFEYKYSYKVVTS